VDNRSAKANTTMVNVDSQISGVTGGRVPSRALHGRGGGSPRCYVCSAAVHIARKCPRGRGGRSSYRGSNGSNPGKVQVSLCTTMDGPPKMMWARSVRLLTMSLKLMK